jgi:hypothetical protein
MTLWNSGREKTLRTPPGKKQLITGSESCMGFGGKICEA